MARGDYSGEGAAVGAGGDAHRALGVMVGEGMVVDHGGGASGKGRWPDMRSLGWPPEGVDAGTAAGDREGEAAARIPPFELAPDPGGTGGVVAVPVPPPPVIETQEAFDPPVGTTAARAVEPLEPARPDAGGALPPGAVQAAALPTPPAADQAGAVLAELRALRSAVEALTAVLSGMGAAGMRPGPGTASLPVRVASDHQARLEIQEYFLRHPGETLYPAQIADALNLPLLKVAELCETLALTGRLSRT